MVSPIGLSPRPVKKEPVANQPASDRLSTQTAAPQDSVKFGARPKRTNNEAKRREIELDLQERFKERTGGYIKEDTLKEYSAYILQVMRDNPNPVSPRTIFLDQALTETTQSLTTLGQKSRSSMSKEEKEFFANVDPNVFNSDLNEALPSDPAFINIQNELNRKLHESLGRKYKNKLSPQLIQEESLKIYKNSQKVPDTLREKLLGSAVDILAQNANSEEKQHIEAARFERKQNRKDEKELKRQQIADKDRETLKFNQSLKGKLYNWYYNIPTDTKSANSDNQPSLLQRFTRAMKSAGPTFSSNNAEVADSQEQTDKIPGTYPNAEASGETPSAENTGNTPEAEGVKKTASTEPPAKTGDSDTPQTPTNDTNKKTEEEEGGILHGWKKTKLATGAGLIAAGVALKMTLIGIVPGLIMSGVGAAVMGWGALNYLFSGKKDETKKEGEQTPAAS